MGSQSEFDKWDSPHEAKWSWLKVWMFETSEGGTFWRRCLKLSNIHRFSCETKVLVVDDILGNGATALAMQDLCDQVCAVRPVSWFHPTGLFLPGGRHSCRHGLPCGEGQDSDFLYGKMQQLNSISCLKLQNSWFLMKFKKMIKSYQSVMPLTLSW